MGTRSLTYIMQDGKNLCCIYRQYDGYPEGLGMELADFLRGRKIVNGFQSEDVNYFNGMGCCAAQVIGHLKNGKTGNVYIYPAESADCGEEFRYTISQGEFTKEQRGNWQKNVAPLMLKVEAGYGNDFKTIWEGCIDNFEAKACQEAA